MTNEHDQRSRLRTRPIGINPRHHLGSLSVHSPMLTGLTVFVVICIWKWNVIHDPPAWDAAMGLFPSAITLAESGFNYGDLLGQPGFIDGGPNVHTTSAYTLMVAALIWLIGAEPAYVFLHIFAFATAGVTTYALMRLVPSLSSAERIVAVLAAITLPILVTQFSLIYVEAPLLAATALAISSANRGTAGRSAWWAFIATAIKPTGIIAAGVAAAVVVQNHKAPHRLRDAALILAPSLAVTGLAASAVRLGEPGSIWVLAHMVRFSGQYLLDVPDVLVIFLFGLLVVVRHSYHGDDNPGSVWMPALLLSFLVAYLFPLFNGFAILPRYYIQIVPFVALAILVSVRGQFGKGAFWTVALILLSWSLANGGGRFYPERGDTNFAAVERSAEYRDLLLLHSEISRYVAGLDPSIPVFYGLPEHYRQSFPPLGYVSASHPNGTFVRNWDGLDLQSLPNSAFLVLDIKFRGGIAIDDTYQEALGDPDWSVATTTLISGLYEARVAYLERR